MKWHAFSMYYRGLILYHLYLSVHNIPGHCEIFLIIPLV